MDESHDDLYDWNSSEAGLQDDMILFYSRDSGYGYYDSDGELVIRSQFDKAFAFRDGLALVEKNGKQMYIDKTGEVIWHE
jgi:hypothetical protein